MGERSRKGWEPARTRGQLESLAIGDHAGRDGESSALVGKERGKRGGSTHVLIDLVGR